LRFKPCKHIDVISEQVLLLTVLPSASKMTSLV